MLLLLFGGARVARANPTGETVLMPAKASGPYFTRKRHKKLLAEEAAGLEAKRKIAEAKTQAAFAAALAQAQDEHRQSVEALKVTAQQPQPLSHGSAQAIIDAMRHAAMTGQAAKAHHEKLMADDEDEAISLLLLH